MVCVYITHILTFCVTGMQLIVMKMIRWVCVCLAFGVTVCSLFIMRFTDLVAKGRPERGELWVGEFVALAVRSSTDFSSKLPLSELSMSYL